jgi:hypothetical protein
MDKGAGPQGTGASEGPEAVLRKTPLFASLTEKELQALVARNKYRAFKKRRSEAISPEREERDAPSLSFALWVNEQQTLTIRSCGCPGVQKDGIPGNATLH